MINGRSAFCDRLLPELPTWETVHLQISKKLLVAALSHTHKIKKKKNPHTFIFWMDIFQLYKVLPQLLPTCDVSVSLSIVLLLSCKNGENL